VVVVVLGGGGGQRDVQNSFGSEHGCVGEHASPVHCLAIVSKHMPLGGGHCARQNSFGGHGVLGEQD
jgi:hypothetical protein